MLPRYTKIKKRDITEKAIFAHIYQSFEILCESIGMQRTESSCFLGEDVLDENRKKAYLFLKPRKEVS